MAARGGARPGKRTRGPHIKRRGKVFYAYLARGVLKTLDTTDEGTARERFRALLADGRVAKKARHEAEAATLASVIDEYLNAARGWTRKGRVSEKARAFAFGDAMEGLGVVYPRQITQRALDDWRRARMEEVSRATVARDEACAGRVMKWAVKRGLADADPFAGRAKLKEPKRPRRRVIHSPAQVARCIAWALGEGLRGWALTCATLEATGFRIDEARHMTKDWLLPGGVRLEPEAGTADEAWTSKGFRPRMVELSKQSRDAIRQFIEWRDTPHGRRPRTGFSERWYAKQADKATAALKLPPGLRAHDSRRRWVTELVRAGVPLATVCDLIGHADVQTTEGYVCAYHDDPKATKAPTPAAVKALARAGGRATAAIGGAKKAAKRKTARPRG